ncbi:MAG: Crp/Fnr family transcriptional regulator [Gemmatimonadetes bacterium]|jgi:CRP/FNR family transcriptional regulator, cyclic AMP receptor protein|nr:Crp/Fnr family transcriptional regulator [Gemmatimonadota bacterium]MBT6146736.1 Crp/Fnr family transcriptional regulator [Gemmatimonadota bacterium]MBT7862500.1 Crp/Fnr family transcriptional regulator [Gemmatimonadota bacterium]
MDFLAPSTREAVSTRGEESDAPRLPSPDRGQQARIAAFLGHVEIFAGLSSVERRRIAADTLVVTVPARTVLSNADTRGPGLGIVWRGAAKVSMVGDNGREVVLALLDPTHVFGELSLLDGEPGRAHVKAMRLTEVIWLPTAHLIEALVRHPELGLSMLQVTASRVRSAERRVRQLAFQDAPERIEATLREIARHRGEQTAAGIVLPRPSQRLLAEMVGSTRETVNRVFKDLESRDIIRCQGRDVVLR